MHRFGGILELDPCLTTGFVDKLRTGVSNLEDPCNFHRYVCIFHSSVKLEVCSDFTNRGNVDNEIELL